MTFLLIAVVLSISVPVLLYVFRHRIAQQKMPGVWWIFAVMLVNVAVFGAAWGCL